MHSAVLELEFVQGSDMIRIIAGTKEGYKAVTQHLHLLGRPSPPAPSLHTHKHTHTFLVSVNLPGPGWAARGQGQGVVGHPEA